jgi:hypothetical protein
MFGCTDRPDEPGSLRTRCAPPEAEQADTSGRGELFLDWTKDCCWTGPRTTTPPRRLATSATVQLLLPSRTTRTVTVRPVDPDTACRPPVGLGPASLTRRSPDTARQPPGCARARCPCFSRSGHGLPAAGRPWTCTLLRRSSDTARQPPGRARACCPCFSDPDTACRPPVGLGSRPTHAPLSGYGPPAAGTRSGPCFS